MYKTEPKLLALTWSQPLGVWQFACAEQWQFACAEQCIQVAAVELEQEGRVNAA
jgi:hypothetical protein